MTDTTELRGLIRTERPRYGQLQDYLTGLLDRLDAAEAEADRLGSTVGPANFEDGVYAALDTEVSELRKALGLPATRDSSPVAAQKDGE